jgi:Family of unknown function (DUF6152)
MIPKRLVQVICVACAWLTLSGAPAFAHHAFDADFDEKDRIALNGTITKMDWVNPHCWISLDVKDPDGKVVTWAVETGAPAALLRHGLTKADFRAGTKVAIDGYRSKRKTATAAGRIIRLADGTELFLR